MALFGTLPTSGIDFTTAYTIDAETTPEYPGSPIALGTKIIGSMGSEWILCKLEAAATCTAGDVLIVTDNTIWEVEGVTNTLATGALGQMLGVAGATGTAGQYVWMQVAGYAAVVNATTSSAAFTALHTTATGGRVIATATGGTTFAVNGMVLTATAAANLGPAILTNPVVGAAD